MASNPRDQIGVDLPDPPEPTSVPQPEPEPEPERPGWLPDNFENPEAFAAAYKESQNKIREQGETQKRLEAQLTQLSEVVETFQAAPPPQPPGTDEAIRARLTQSFEEDPIGTIAYLSQQYANAALDERAQAWQQQSNPEMMARQERDNQLLAMMVDQRLGETIDDWDDYRDKVGEAIVADQSLIPEEVLNNPEATVTAIRRVYQFVKANDILEQASNGNFVQTQMKKSAQTMTGSGVRAPESTPAEDKLDALKQAVQGVSYAAWRGA